MPLKAIPFERNHKLYSGQTFQYMMRYHHKAGDPYQLGDWDAWMPYGPTFTASIGELTVSNGGIVLDNEGLIQITFTAIQTLALANNPDIPVDGSTGTLRYNFSLKDPAFEFPLGVKLFMYGLLFIEQTVPRPE